MGATAFSTVWPSNMHLFPWANLVSLVPWVQTAISSKAAKYFRLELVLLAVRLMLSFLFAVAVGAHGVRSIFTAFQWLKAGMPQSASRLMTVCWMFNVCIFL